MAVGVRETLLLVRHVPPKCSLLHQLHLPSQNLKIPRYLRILPGLDVLGEVLRSRRLRGQQDILPDLKRS